MTFFSSGCGWPQAANIREGEQLPEGDYQPFGEWIVNLVAGHSDLEADTFVLLHDDPEGGHDHSGTTEVVAVYLTGKALAAWEGAVLVAEHELKQIILGGSDLRQAMTLGYLGLKMDLRGIEFREDGGAVVESSAHRVTIDSKGCVVSAEKKHSRVKYEPAVAYPVLGAMLAKTLPSDERLRNWAHGLVAKRLGDRY